MNKKREKIVVLRLLMQKELQKAKARFEKVEKAAIEISRSAAASPSQAGDRFHSQGQADIVRENVKRLEKIFEETEKEIDKEVQGEIKPICWVELEYNSEEKDNFYFVSEPLSISGYKLVSSKSPFGLTLINKKVGDAFVFKTAGFKKTGKIIALE